jgi:hypothetical protein
MENTTYNGWTNYATWRINLEIFDGWSPYDYYQVEKIDPIALADDCKEYAEQIIFECGSIDPSSLGGSYINAFLSEVNWYEIAQHAYENYKEQA